MTTVSYNFSFTGSYKEFTLAPGVYSFKLAGSNAAADEKVADFGYGAVVSAKLRLKKKTTFYSYVGGQTTFNGGGNGQFASGSASDVRLVSGNWSNFESLKSRVIVAGGGGGTDSNDRGGDGGLNGYSSSKNHGKGGNQTSGGSGLVKGGFGYGGHSSRSTGGGGGGYYGGGSSDDSINYGGGGGSSFISGYSPCNAIKENSTSTNISHTGSSLHYSGIRFTGVVVQDGANAATGYVRVQLLYRLNPSYCKYKSIQQNKFCFYILVFLSISM